MVVGLGSKGSGDLASGFDPRVDELDAGSWADPGIWRAAIDRAWPSPSPRYAADHQAASAALADGADLVLLFPLAGVSPATLAAEARVRAPSCVIIGVAPQDTDGGAGCNDIVERGSPPQTLVDRARRCLAPPVREPGDNQALDTMPIGVALLDPEGAFRFVNHTLRELIEVPVETPIERFHTRAFFQDRTAWEQLRAESRQGRRTTLLGVQTLQGRRCLLEVTVCSTRQGATLLLREPPAEDHRVRELANALSRSEERYRAILDDQSDMVARSLPDGTLTYVNPATCRTLGLPADQLNGRNWHDFIPNAEALRSAVARIDSLDSGQASVNNDTPVRTASGETRWFAWENRAIFDRQGRVSEISAVGRDVTDRRRAEQALRESQATLQSFYDGTPLLMGVAEVAEGEVLVIHANAAMARFLGTTCEGVSGRTFTSFGTPPDLQALWMSHFEQSRREGRGARFDYLCSGPSGDYSLNATVSFLGGDERPRFSFVVEDETERREVERKLVSNSTLLRESEGRLATVFREAPVAIAISRLADGTFLDVNPAFCSMLGYARDEVLGNTAVGLELTHDASYRERMLAELAIRESVNGRSASLRNRAGEGVECLVSYARIRLVGQDCLVTILQDVTERRRTELRLEQALHEREVLLREIHHRVKNNLQLLSSLMSLELARGPGAEVRQVAESLGRRIHAMAVVHEHLYGVRDLSSLQADVYLGDLLRANLATHGDAAARLTVAVEVAPLALSLETALRVGLIVSELTSNALRHAFAQERDGTLSLRLGRLGERGFELVVSDNGVGLGQAGGDDSRTAPLGLRLVKQIARQLAGDLTCANQPGTTWTLRVAEVT